MPQDVTRTITAHANGTPVFLGFHAYGHAVDFRLEGRQELGRAAMPGSTTAENAPDIAIPCAYVSSHHGEVGVVQGRVFYRDLNSTNGTLLNGEPCVGDALINEGDILSFAPGCDPDSVAFKLVLAYDDGRGFEWQRIALTADIQEVAIGRTTGSLQLNDPTVSVRHASFFQTAKGLVVLDHHSKNGVFVNGNRVDGGQPVQTFDIVRVGAAWFSVHEDCLWVGMPKRETAGTLEKPSDSTHTAPVVQSDAVEVPPLPSRPPRQPEARPRQTEFEGSSLFIDIIERNVWSRVAKKTLLKDIHITVDPGDMVLILGGSGAGKSTFIKAVMGYDKAEGNIHYGDLDVYEEYDRLRYQIGYVPQQDLLRMNDTVEMTLLAAAQMRMPGHPSRRECQERADWASEMLGLGREQQTMVGSLSGGQRKRLSIAVELVGDPSLFFLDEPDSGLDGVMARALMENLRDIADMGKIVLVISHGPDRASDLFTKVLVLAKSDRDGSGHLAFYGTVSETQEFFGVDTLEGVVRRINRIDEGGEGLADYYLDKASEQFGYPPITGPAGN